jgi:hypothetical protein
MSAIHYNLIQFAVSSLNAVPKPVSWVPSSSTAAGGSFSSLGVLKSSKDAEPDLECCAGSFMPCTTTAALTRHWHSALDLQNKIILPGVEHGLVLGPTGWGGEHVLLNLYPPINIAKITISRNGWDIKQIRNACKTPLSNPGIRREAVPGLIHALLVPLQSHNNHLIIDTI